jgi:hypothetical protein
VTSIVKQAADKNNNNKQKAHLCLLLGFNGLAHSVG